MPNYMPNLAIPLPNRPNKLPMAATFRVSGAIFLGFSLIAAGLGLWSGLFEWSPKAEGLRRNAMIALFVPALIEEIVFRVPLLCAKSIWVYGALSWSTLGYAAWHVIEAKTFLPEAAPWFLDPVFLLITALFGVAAAITVSRTGRLLPAVVMHWAMVVGWKQLFGGPSLVGA
ncbi:MAG: CPBP family glutamic-type intramembrane protease, partial [Pseudomonadota bacterium]